MYALWAEILFWLYLILIYGFNFYWVQLLRICWLVKMMITRWRKLAPTAMLFVNISFFFLFYFLYYVVGVPKKREENTYDEKICSLYMYCNHWKDFALFQVIQQPFNSFVYNYYYNNKDRSIVFQITCTLFFSNLTLRKYTGYVSCCVSSLITRLLYKYVHFIHLMDLFIIVFRSSPCNWSTMNVIVARCPWIMYAGFLHLIFHSLAHNT